MLTKPQQRRTYGPLNVATKWKQELKRDGEREGRLCALTGASVAGPCADHSAAMRLSSCLLYNRRHVMEPHRCSEHFSLPFSLLLSPPARLPASPPAALYSVLTSLVATTGLNG